jgi:3-hydroxyisobutyrate dehydrogenase-like beta-hydroxyacid dehydrogenase
MKKIGFIGLGTMGLPMSVNLARAGYDLTVFNRTPAKTVPVVAAGARAADSLVDLFRRTETVILMLAGPSAIDATLGALVDQHGEILRDKLIVNMGTNPPSYTSSLADRVEKAGARFVDAPVFGSKRPAEEGQLLVMASGPEEVIKEVTPLFAVMGNKIVNCGLVPKASMMKLTVNLIQIAMMEGLAEGVHFAKRGGLDLGILFQIIQNGPVGNNLYALKGQKYLASDYSPHAPVYAVRDVLKQIADTAYEIEANIPNTMCNLNLSTSAVKSGLAKEDFCALVKLLDA